MIRWLFSFIFIVLLMPLHAQVVINEYSCSNVYTLPDNDGDYEDWVEFYNTGSTAVNMSGYYLSDKPSNPDKWMFPSVSIPANGYLIVFCSGKNVNLTGYCHTNFKLTQCKPEHIVFSNPSLTVLENITLSPTKTDHSRGRTTDGASTWSLFRVPSPGSSNFSPCADYAIKPVFSQPAGFYGGSVSLIISSPDAGVTIRYTTDGTEPTAASTQYSAPVSINNTLVLKAKSFSSDPNIPPSFVETNTYFIGVTHSIPVVSVSGNEIADLLNGSYIYPQTTLEYFNQSGQLKTESTGEANKHGNDSWAYGQRGIDFVTKDQFGYNYALLDTLFHLKTRSEFQRVILKACANDNYPFSDGAHIRDSYVHTLSLRGGLHLDVRTYEPCILYCNGQYWGVYDLREKVDDADFTNFYYNTDVPDLQMLKTWGGTWSEYGGAQAQTDWDNLKNFILSNSMAVPANYHYADSLLNVKSLVDYFVLNSYVVCSDWLNWNTEWWRGLNPNAAKKKWRFCLWDEDATFGHYINYTGVPSTLPDADPCNPEQFPDPGGQGHVLILDALMANDVFKQYYVARFADLSNTVFSCDNMQFLLDSLIAVITPEMNGQVNRWGGTFSGWQANVQALKNFIDARCLALSQGMIDCYTLTGPYNVTLLTDPPGAGKININSLSLSAFPWSGNYYGNMSTLLKATAYSGYQFERWEAAHHTFNPGIYNDSVKITLTIKDTIIAHFKSTLPDEIDNNNPPGELYQKPETPLDTLEIKIPNVFTPNGDGSNDVFAPSNVDFIVNGEMQIFNRWGKLIFSTENLKTGWNGRVGSQKCSDGVYYWLINYTDKARRSAQLKGFINLVR
ncbi:MAG: CotH kinase family protein [Bacteroidota bacterium]